MASERPRLVGMERDTMARAKMSTVGAQADRRFHEDLHILALGAEGEARAILGETEPAPFQVGCDLGGCVMVRLATCSQIRPLLLDTIGESLAAFVGE
jgi:hypothetical protein